MENKYQQVRSVSSYFWIRRVFYAVFVAFWCTPLPRTHVSAAFPSILATLVSPADAKTIRSI